MPEQNKPKREPIPHTMSAADEIGQLVHVTCNHCRIVRYLRPRDLIRIVGDVSIFAVEERMRCETCDRRDYVHVKLVLPTTAERQTIKVRRIADIRYVRRIIWGKDEPA